MYCCSQSLEGSSIATGPNLLKSRTAMTMTMIEINRSMPLIENQFPLFISLSVEKLGQFKAKQIFELFTLAFSGLPSIILFFHSCFIPHKLLKLRTA